MSARNRGIFGMERVANEARRLGRGCVSHSGVQTPSYSSHGAGTVASEGKRVMSTGGQILGSHELKPERASLGCHLALA